MNGPHRIVDVGPIVVIMVANFHRRRDQIAYVQRERAAIGRQPQIRVPKDVEMLENAAEHGGHRGLRGDRDRAHRFCNVRRSSLLLPRIRLGSGVVAHKESTQRSHLKEGFLREAVVHKSVWTLSGYYPVDTAFIAALIFCWGLHSLAEYELVFINAACSSSRYFFNVVRSKLNRDAPCDR